MISKFSKFPANTLSSRQFFWCFVVVHLIVWTLAPTLVCPNAPLDVIEGYAWGYEWLIGTYKHPPMQAWWLSILDYVTGHASWSHFFASQLAIVIAFWAIWQTGLRILDARLALMSVLLLEGVIYYNFTSPEFNPNVLQLPFWALISLFYHRAIKENKLHDWILLGVVSAGGLYSKYSTVLLLAALTLLTLARPESRRKLGGPGPYLSFGLAFLLFMPHLQWLVGNHFLPFHYARERLQPPAEGITIHSIVLTPLFFIGSQLLAILPALLILVSLIGRRRAADESVMRKFDRTFLATITFGPCFLILVMACVFGLQIHDMWAMPFWNFLGLWALATLRPALSTYSLRRFAWSGISVTVLILLAYICGVYFYPYVMEKGLRINFPGDALAKNIEATWEGRYHKPLTYVIGDMWLAGNIAYYNPQRAHVLIEGNYTFSPWINPEDLKHQGGILVWCISQCAASYKENMPLFLNDFPHAEIQSPLILPRQTDAPLKPVTVGWAILPPE